MAAPPDGQNRRIATAALLLTALGLCGALLQRCGAKPGGPPPAATEPDEHVRPGVAEQASGDAIAHPPTDTAAASREAVAPAPTADDREWCVQLTGLDPRVPWSSPLVIEFEKHHVVQAAVDADGACRFVPPKAASNPGIQMMRFVADDPNYRLQRAHDRTDALQATGRMELAVHPVAELRGRVLGPDGDGVAARVRAFAWDGAAPVEPLLGLTTSDPTGLFALQVPPGMALLVVADVPDAEGMVLGAGYDSPSRILPERPGPQRSIPTADLHLHERAPSRPDLLPAAARTEGLLGTPRDVPDLRLGSMATLTGRVLSAAGRPLGLVDVVAYPQPTAGPFHRSLRWSTTHGVVAAARARTDLRGAFAMWLAPGVPHEVVATATAPLMLAGEPRATATAPGQVELTAPGDLVRVRVVADGAAVGRATIDVGGVPWPTDASGELLLTLPPDHVRLRGRADVRASTWTELPPGVRPATVTLELLTEPLAEVRIIVRGAPQLQQAEFEWRRGSSPPLQTAASRPDAATPFVVQVPPGSYGLTIRDKPTGLRRAHALLPVQLDVDVPPAGLTTTVTAAFGGTLRLDVRDANGLRVGGHFTLSDAAGQDVTAPMLTIDPEDTLLGVRIAAPGELHAAGPNLLASPLPPGDYTLTIEPRGHRRVVRRVSVAAHAEATVTVRLD